MSEAPKDGLQPPATSNTSMSSTGSVTVQPTQLKPINTSTKPLPSGKPVDTQPPVLYGPSKRRADDMTPTPAKQPNLSSTPSTSVNSLKPTTSVPQYRPVPSSTLPGRTATYRSAYPASSTYNPTSVPNLTHSTNIRPPMHTTNIRPPATSKSTVREQKGPVSKADRRAHHNALERKRRDHIKDSFSLLRECVPSLNGEKVSRAQILNKATDYIQYMRTRNSRHQQELEELKRQNSSLQLQSKAASTQSQNQSKSS